MPLASRKGKIRVVDIPNKNLVNLISILKLSEKEIDVNKYFDEDGYLHRKNTIEMLSELLNNARKKVKSWNYI